MRRVLLTGDWHCGNVFGLTPPDWIKKGYEALQKPLWTFWGEVTRDEYDVAVVNGDLIDGAIDTSGKVTVDRLEQIEMAREALAMIRAKKIYVTLGTPLHTGGESAYESLLGDAKEEWRIDIDGVRIHVKHKINASKTGYGQESLLAREALGQAVYDQEVLRLPPPRLIVRSHAHRFCYVQNEIVDGLIIPCLQYPFSWYGATISKWQYAMGVAELQIEPTGYTIEPRLIKLNLSEWRRYERI